MKTRFLPFLVSLLFAGFSFGQVSHYALNQKAALIKNKVSEIREYPVQDSVSFFKEHPDGYYVRFNEAGKIIEKNGSSTKRTDASVAVETRTYFFYDDEGELIGRVALSSDSENPVNTVALYGKDSIRKTMSYLNLDNVGDGMAKLHIEEEPFATASVNRDDTVRLSRTHIRVPWFFWGDSVYWEDVYLDKQGRADSSRRVEMVMSKPRLENHVIRCRYMYASDGSLKQQTRTTYNTQNEGYRVEELLYDKNGLLYLYRERYLPLNKVEEYRFVYTFRKK